MTFEWCLNDDETVFEHEEHAFAPYTGACGGAYAIRPYPADRRLPRGIKSRIHAENVSTCTRPAWLASLTPLGNLQRRVLTLPRPRKRSNNLFHHFRPLGNPQTTCFIISDPSETFKQPVSSNPSPRKPSNNLFHHFRALGASAEAGEVCLVRAFEVPGQLGWHP